MPKYAQYVECRYGECRYAECRGAIWEWCLEAHQRGTPYGDI